MWKKRSTQSLLLCFLLVLLVVSASVPAWPTGVHAQEDLLRIKYPNQTSYYYVSQSIVRGTIAYHRYCLINTYSGKDQKLIMNDEIDETQCFVDGESYLPDSQYTTGITDNGKTQTKWLMVPFTADKAKHGKTIPTSSLFDQSYPPDVKNLQLFYMPAHTYDTAYLNGSAYHTFIRESDRTQQYSRSLSSTDSKGWNQICRMPFSSTTWYSNCQQYQGNPPHVYKHTNQTVAPNLDSWDYYSDIRPRNNNKVLVGSHIGAAGSVTYLVKENGTYTHQDLLQNLYDESGKVGAYRICKINDYGHAECPEEGWTKRSVSSGAPKHYGYSIIAYPHDGNKDGVIDNEITRQYVIDRAGNVYSRKCALPNWSCNSGHGYTQLFTQEQLAASLFGQDVNTGFKASEITEYVFRSTTKLH